MLLARGDMRDHIVSHKNYHRPSWRHYRALQRQERLTINFCEIFGAVRFSTFATVSAISGSSPLALAFTAPIRRSLILDENCRAPRA